MAKCSWWTLAGLGWLVALPVLAQEETSFPQTTLINRHIQAKWQENRLKPSPMADDFEFCRRVFLDLIGRIPTTAELLEFQRDRSADRRRQLIHRLLHAKAHRVAIRLPGQSQQYREFNYAQEFANHWADVWTVWLMTRSAPELYRQQMHRWLQEQFRNDAPYDQFVRQLLTASGKNDDNGAVNYFVQHLGTPVPGKLRDEEGAYDAVPITSRTTRLFLGIQTQCTQCHDHPFNSEWKQDYFWGVNAFFRQIDRNPPAPANNDGSVGGSVEVLDNPDLNPGAAVFFERRNGLLEQTSAAFLRDLHIDPEHAYRHRKGIPDTSKQSRREVLADYVCAHDNFARAAVNRFWGHFFGRGLNELPAIDDFGAHNPVIHDELLDDLAKAFQEYDYNIKALLEWICNSAPYHLTYVAIKDVNDSVDAEAFFSRMPLRAMTPEQLFASIMTALNQHQELTDSEREQRAEQRERWLNKLVQNFGDDEGNEVTFNGTVIQALLMMNGSELNGELANKRPGNPVKRAVQIGLSRRGSLASKEAAMIDSLYLAALSRTASRKAGELRVIQTELNKARLAIQSNPKWAKQYAKNPTAFHEEFMQDLFWALMNTNEFILIH